MCGIAGRFHSQGLRPQPGWMEKAGRLLAHRGPDGSGFFKDESCELIHRRLAIIDLSPRARQPIPNEDGTLLAVFNGEIYNFRELRQLLESLGHRFRSETDSEVLVHLYEVWGSAMVERLRGMFAFAIYDQRHKTLLLARDRFGIKPLFYLLREGECVFASEMKAILTLQGFKPTLDRQACYDYLGLGYIPEPATGFNEIQVLPKGATLFIDASGPRLSPYSPIRAGSNHRDFLETVESTSQALKQAVKKQSVSDVPMGVLLSGGIDSSLITAAYSSASPSRPMTLSIGFPDPQYDETPFAQSVSNCYGTDHVSVPMRPNSMDPDLVLKLLRHFDQPFADSSLIPTYWAAKGLRDHGISCALSGDGGDEVFGGYARFWRAERLACLMKFPDSMNSILKNFGDAISGWTQDGGRQLAKASRLAQIGRHDLAFLVAGFSNWVNEEEKRGILTGAANGLLPVYRHFGNGSPAFQNLEHLSQRMTENLFSLGLPSDMLRKVDMMSMLAGVEMRVPFLDEDLVSIGRNLPHAFKTDGKKGKLVLRQIAKRWLPSDVSAHIKQGFSIPLDRVLDSRFEALLRDFLLGPDSRVSSFLDLRQIKGWIELFEKAKKGKWGGKISRAGVYQRLLIVLSLEIWMRDYRLNW